MKFEPYSAPPPRRCVYILVMRPVLAPLSLLNTGSRLSAEIEGMFNFVLSLSLFLLALASSQIYV